MQFAAAGAIVHRNLMKSGGTNRVVDRDWLAADEYGIGQNNCFRSIKRAYELKEEDGDSFVDISSRLVYPWEEEEELDEKDFFGSDQIL